MRFSNAVVVLLAGASPSLAALPWLPLNPFVNRRAETSWTPPSETQAVAVAGNVAAKNNNNQYSPRPTGEPAGDVFGKMELAKRIDGYNMGTDTCGFVASSWSNPFTCVESTARCTNNGRYLGCCDDEECTFLKTTCLDYEASRDGRCDSAKDWHTVCCSERLYSECYTYLFSTTASPGITLSMLACEGKRGSGTLLDYPPEFTRAGGTIASSAATTTSSTSTESESETPTGTAPNPDDDDDDEGGGANVGAIVGGTIGGLAAVGAIGLLVFFFLIKKGKNKAPPQGGTTPAPMMQQPQSPTSPGGSNFAVSPGGGFSQPGMPQAYDPTHQQQHYAQNAPPGYGQPVYQQHQQYAQVPQQQQYAQVPQQQSPPQQQTYGQYHSYGNQGAVPGQQYVQVAPQGQAMGPPEHKVEMTG